VDVLVGNQTKEEKEANEKKKKKATKEEGRKKSEKRGCWTVEGERSSIAIASNLQVCSNLGRACQVW
jgi:hypothetical protein